MSENDRDDNQVLRALGDAQRANGDKRRAMRAAAIAEATTFAKSGCDRRLDRALQRLRKAKAIRYQAGGWVIA